MKEEGAHDVIGGTDNALSLPVLRGGVRARKTISNAVSGEKGAEGRVDEFTTVIALQSFDDYIILSANEGEKAL